MKTFRTDPDRFGIRARLLTLLLPGILGLLILDSWNDYRALTALVQDAYDRSMLESVNALRSSLSLAKDGSLRLNAPVLSPALSRSPAQTTSGTTDVRQKHVHVSLTPLEAIHVDATQSVGASREVTLLGEKNLPDPPQPLRTDSPPAWYDSYHDGKPVRLVAYRGLVTDGQGRRFELLIKVAQDTSARAQAEALSLDEQLKRDARMVLVVVLLVWLGVTWSLRPLERLRKSVLQNKGRDLNPLDTSDVPHEVAPLVHAINQQIASHRELLEEQAQFLADASHQLRTPLAIMLTQAGVALRQNDPDQLHETLRAIVIQIARSRRLCEQLLSLAHASDSHPAANAPEIVDLNTIARDVVLQYLALAHEKNLDLGWMDARAAMAAVPQGDMRAGKTEALSVPVVPVLARGPELHEALANLVHNAIVYTPTGGSITVTVSTLNGTALVEIRDDGPGIPAARRTEVFERFRQAGPNTGAGQHGAGLGLAIARAYARRNGGEIDLGGAAVGEAEVGTTGLRATLRLALAEKVLPSQ